MGGRVVSKPIRLHVPLWHAVSLSSFLSLLTASAGRPNDEELRETVGRNTGLRCIIRTRMTRVEALEREVQNLTPEELAAFRDWFAEYDWQVWDRQLERDVAAGKLDKLAAEARAEYERGETTEL